MIVDKLQELNLLIVKAIISRTSVSKFVSVIRKITHPPNPIGFVASMLNQG